MSKSRITYGLYGLLAVLVLAAPCCGGGPCDSYFQFYDPVPPMTLAPGETASYELLSNVWAVVNSCSGNETGRWLPETVEVFSNNTAIATVWLDHSMEPYEERSSNRRSLLRVESKAAGQTEIVLRIRTEVNCEEVYDATHFTVTVTAPTP